MPKEISVVEKALLARAFRVEFLIEHQIPYAVDVNAVQHGHHVSGEHCGAVLLHDDQLAVGGRIVRIGGGILLEVPVSVYVLYLRVHDRLNRYLRYGDPRIGEFRSGEIDADERRLLIERVVRKRGDVYLLGRGQSIPVRADEIELLFRGERRLVRSRRHIIIQELPYLPVLQILKELVYLHLQELLPYG